MASAPPPVSAVSTAPIHEDLVADRDRLVNFGMAAVFAACVVFGCVRFALQLSTGHATPWWGNAAGSAVMLLLYLWYRGDRARRSPVAVHGTALVATVALTIPAAYGMASSKWWLALVGFSVLLMGRRAEGILWAAVTLVLLPFVAIVEGDLTIDNAIGEPPLERAMAGFFFLALLFALTWAYREAAQTRARQLAETAASLRAANQVKSRFLAHISHEVRTPLHGVIAMTDLALRGTESDTVREQIRTAQRSAETLLGILTNVLDVTRAESDALVLDPRPFDLHATLTDVLGPLAAQARGKGLSFLAEAEADVVATRIGDRVRLGQIVLNLVMNALKFTSKGGIRLHISAVADRVYLRVTDTGVGIAADKLAHIFEPFAQASAADSHALGGVGLGLAIVRELAGRMDGHVSVTSEIGRGSTFSVEARLPCVPGSALGPTDLLAVADRPSRTPSPVSQPLLDVLVCEDNVVNQTVLLAMLARLGHKVTMVTDGLLAWNLLTTRSFDLVLTDVEMPGLSGIELTVRIRTREREAGLPRMPVVGATAHVGEEEQHQLLDAGMDAHLGKPFTLAQLSAVIERVIPTPAPVSRD